MGEWLGVIGDPIEHSLSPIMHRKWFADFGWSHHYQAFRVKRDDLKQAVDGLRALGAKGFNVTIPHKVAIMPLLDEIDDEARALGAVNTVIQADGRLLGTNTDGLGFIESLKEKNVSYAGADVLILGAGGAARAVGLSLARHAGRVDVAGRTLEKAEALAHDIAKTTASAAYTLERAAARLDGYRLIINATPVGMTPNIDAAPLSLERISDQATCIDLIYRPLETRFMKEARQKGARVLNGLPMLIHQGALAFERWFGRRPDTTGMETYLSQILGAHR